MSSFVRAVLSASGALSTKEDLSATICRLEKRGEELKSLLRVEVESRYETLGPSVGILDAIDKLESVKGEMESLKSSIQVESVDKACEEMEVILDKLEALSGTIAVAQTIQEGWTLMEKIDASLGVNDNLSASESASLLGTLLENVQNAEDIDKDQAKAFEAIRQEYISSLDILQESLSSSWDEKVYIASKDDEVTFVFSSDLQPLIKSMQTADLLSNKLKIFAESLYSQILKPLLNKEATILSESKICHNISFQSTLPSPYKIFDRLKIILSFLSVNNISVTPEKSLILSVSDIIRERLLKSIINDVLSPAVPESNVELGEFKERMGDIVGAFESHLKIVGFLPEENDRLTDFIYDIETIFVNKKICNYLFEARKKIKMPLYETMEVSPDALKEEEALLKLKSKVGTFPMNEDDLPLPDKGGFLASSNPFHFPKCRISKAVWELVRLVYQILDEAAETTDNPFLSSRLVQGSRYIFELYLNMINVVHEDDFNKLPQVSAVAHNDSFYLAHHCMLLGFHYRDFIIPTEKSQFITYVDFLPFFRETGEKILKRQIEDQRATLLEHVKGLDINSGSPETIFRRITHGLLHLKKVWRDVLPQNVYPRIIGTLINSTLEELIKNVVDLENIVADSAVQTYNAFYEFSESLPQMFEEEHQAMKYVRYWLRFKELIFILNANLREIEHRWAEGKGPLASEFSVDEIKRLIRAIFQNTERRATVLSRIKYES